MKSLDLSRPSFYFIRRGGSSKARNSYILKSSHYLPVSSQETSPYTGIQCQSLKFTRAGENTSCRNDFRSCDPGCKVEIFIIVTSDAQNFSAQYSNFRKSCPIWTFLGSLERRILGLSNEPKIFEIG